MYKQFIYDVGSNPYITTNNKEFFRMICKYDVEQISDITYVVHGEREHNGKKSYTDYKNIIRDFAIEWQLFFSECNYSYSQLAEYNDFFETYGSRYGLLEEFRENGII